MRKEFATLYGCVSLVQCPCPVICLAGLSGQIKRILLVAGCLGMLTIALTDTVQASPRWQSVSCAGDYKQHLQGVCTDEKGNLYWSFTDRLVKTDHEGTLLKSVEVASHHGDLCYSDGKIYVAVNLGLFNQPVGRADSWIYVYDANSLAEESRHEVQDVVHGAGGIEFHEGRFYVVGGLPQGVEENCIYEYDSGWNLEKRHIVKSGYTVKGIQTILFHDGHWWLGCVGDPPVLLKVDPAMNIVGRWPIDCSKGLVGVEAGKFLVASGPKTKKKRHRGVLAPALVSPDKGLKLLRDDRKIQ